MWQIVFFITINLLNTILSMLIAFLEMLGFSRVNISLIKYLVIVLLFFKIYCSIPLLVSVRSLFIALLLLLVLQLQLLLLETLGLSLLQALEQLILLVLVGTAHELQELNLLALFKLLLLSSELLLLVFFPPSSLKTFLLTLLDLLIFWAMNLRVSLRCLENLLELLINFVVLIGHVLEVLSRHTLVSLRWLTSLRFPHVYLFNN